MKGLPGGAPRFSLKFSPNTPIQTWMRLAEVGEKKSFESIWVADENPSPPFRDVYGCLTAIAMKTSTVGLGTSIVNPYTRHPALIAVATLTLHELSGGRAIVGLGPGGSMPLTPLEVEMWDRPLETIRNSVDLLRKLFRGERVSSDSDVVRSRNIELFSKPSRPIPIYIGSRGPRMLALAGEIADGVLMNALPIPYLKEAIGFVHKGAEKAGRKLDDLDIIYEARFAISEDRKEARNLVRPNVAYTISDSPSLVIKRAGIDEKEQRNVRELLRNRGLNSASSAVTEEMIDMFAVAGNPKDCAAGFLKILKLGIKHLSLSSPFGPNAEEALNLVSQEVIPQVVSRNW